ncbi:MAG TPA: ABC transporter ATP-binding protein [Pirellulales bacterium]|nr:ABC transporter ATP-binding protein [Pirellulales bacterium]
MIPVVAESPAVELLGVTKKFRGGLAVDNLNLTVPRGSTLGLIGPNGAGKSTTIRMLMGTLAPSLGQVRVFGLNVANHAARIRPRVGYVPERHDVYPWMTVSEVIAFTSAFYPHWDVGFCRELMDLFALDGRKAVKHLSKGMLVKLSLLLAVSHHPELLILDEPTSGLDPIVHDDFLEAVLRSVCGRGTTVLHSSHNLEDIRRLADSVCILRAGRILVHGGVDQLLASVKRIRAVLIDGHLPRWVPDGTVSQKIQRREWLLTVDRFDKSLADRIRRENPVESVDVFDLSLGEVFKDYVLGGAEP